MIYPIVGHWIWGDGWLSAKGMIDFAGSTVVHSVGGWAALAGAILVGPRLGKYNKDGSANAIEGHSMALASLGTLILWFAWFGFNSGSTLSVGDGSQIAHVAINTNLAAVAGAAHACRPHQGRRRSAAAGRSDREPASAADQSRSDYATCQIGRRHATPGTYSETRRLL